MWVVVPTVLNPMLSSRKCFFGCRVVFCQSLSKCIVSLASVVILWPVYIGQLTLRVMQRNLHWRRLKRLTFAKVYLKSNSIKYVWLNRECYAAPLCIELLGRRCVARLIQLLIRFHLYKIEQLAQLTTCYSWLFELSPTLVVWGPRYVVDTNQAAYFASL